MPANIVIIGAGRIGTAVGRVLKKKGNAVSFWDVVPGRVKGQKPLERIIAKASLVILCVPSWATRESIVSFRKFLPPSATVLSFAKGIESETRKTMDQLLAELLPRHACGLIGGPMMAEEIEKGKSGVAVIAMKYRNAFKKIFRLCPPSGFRVEYSPDVRGVALAGVLKNVYAFCLGIAEGAGWGNNDRGWLASRCISEMVLIGSVMGVSQKTVIGTSGVGDLIATAFSPHSRNRSVGEEIVRTGTCCLKSEATVSIEPLCRLLGKNVRAFPILSGLRSVVNGKRAPGTVVAGWRKRAAKDG